jgi:hypothetical protein
MVKPDKLELYLALLKNVIQYTDMLMRDGYKPTKAAHAKMPPPPKPQHGQPAVQQEPVQQVGALPKKTPKHGSLVQAGVVGTVTKYRTEENFGFITAPALPRSVFLRSDFMANAADAALLREKITVSFDAYDTPKCSAKGRYEARNVRIVG